jgi:hypothetical protein
MLYREMIAVFSVDPHKTHTMELCGQNIEFANVKVALYYVTALLSGIKTPLFNLKLLASEALCFCPYKLCSNVITFNRYCQVSYRDTHKSQYVYLVKLLLVQ